MQVTVVAWDDPEARINEDLVGAYAEKPYDTIRLHPSLWDILRKYHPDRYLENRREIQVNDNWIKLSEDISIPYDTAMFSSEGAIVYSMIGLQSEKRFMEFMKLVKPTKTDYARVETLLTPPLDKYELMKDATKVVESLPNENYLKPAFLRGKMLQFLETMGHELDDSKPVQPPFDVGFYTLHVTDDELELPRSEFPQMLQNQLLKVAEVFDKQIKEKGEICSLELETIQPNYFKFSIGILTNIMKKQMARMQAQKEDE